MNASPLGGESRDDAAPRRVAPPPVRALVGEGALAAERPVATESAGARPAALHAPFDAGALLAELTALRERAACMQALALTLAAAREPADVLAVAAEAGRLAVRADGAAVMALAEDAPRTLTLAAASGFDPVMLGPWTRYPLAARTPVAEAVRDARAIWLASAPEILAAYPSLVEFVHDTSCHALVAVPFVTGEGRAIGALALGFGAPRRFAADERAFLVAVVGQCAQALERAHLAREEREQAGRVARLQAVTAALSSAVTPSEVALATLTEGMLAVGASGGSLGLLAEDGRTLRLVHSQSGETHPPLDWPEFPVDLPVPMADAVQTGEPLFLESPTDLYPRYEQLREDYEARGVQAVAALPLAVRGGREAMLGAMVLLFREPTRLDPDDRALMLAIARQCAQALERARLYVAQARAAARAQQVQQVTAALSGAVTPEAVARVVVTTAVDALGAHAAVVARASADGKSLTIVDAVGYDRSVLRAWQERGLDAKLPMMTALRRREPIYVRARAERGATFGEYDAGFEAAACLPLVSGGRTVGAFVLSFATPHSFDEEERRLLETLAETCAQALERSRLYSDADSARAQAEEANRAKSDFLAKMSHELRTPLNAVGGYAELMEMGLHGPVTEAQRNALDRIRKSQRALLARIDELLAFARVETGRIEFEFEDVSLAEVLRDVEALLAPQASARGLTLRFGAEPALASDATPGEPRALSAWADRDKLLQVLINLGTNAVKYTPAGGTVTFACGETRDLTGRGWVRVAVRDTGIGIPRDKLDAIFDPFVQVKKGRNEPTEGIGLGLAIARQLSGAMQGRLAVESELGSGSTFTVTLPRGRARTA